MGSVQSTTQRRGNSRGLTPGRSSGWKGECEWVILLPGIEGIVGESFRRSGAYSFEKRGEEWRDAGTRTGDRFPQP